MVYHCPSCPLLVLPVVCTIKNFFKHHRPHISYLDWYFTPNYINERLKWFSNSGIPNLPGVLQYTDLADFVDLLEVVGLPRSLYCYLRGCFTNSNLSLFNNFYFYNTISCSIYMQGFYKGELTLYTITSQQEKKKFVGMEYAIKLQR